MRTDGINYLDPIPVGYCEQCQEPIYKGDRVYENRYGEMFHADGVYRVYQERDNRANTLTLSCAEVWAIEQGDFYKMLEGAGLELKQW